MSGQPGLVKPEVDLNAKVKDLESDVDFWKSKFLELSKASTSTDGGGTRKSESKDLLSSSSFYLSSPTNEKVEVSEAQEEPVDRDVDTYFTTEKDLNTDSDSSSPSEHAIKRKKIKSRVLASPSPPPADLENKKKISTTTIMCPKVESSVVKDVEIIELSSDPETEDEIQSKGFVFKDYLSHNHTRLKENQDQLTTNSNNLNLNEGLDIRACTAEKSTVKKENFDSEDSHQEVKDHKSYTNQLLHVNVKAEDRKEIVDRDSYKLAEITCSNNTSTSNTTSDTFRKYFNSTTNESVSISTLTQNSGNFASNYSNDPNHLEMGDFRGILVNDGTTGEFNGETFHHSQDLRKKLQGIFHHQDFRPIQLQAMNAALLNHDCFILMPSGGGKSLCYQLPALLSEGLTVVVSPSKAHIMDQVMKLDALGILVAYLSDDPNFTKQNNDVLHVLEHNSTPILKLLYVTPDKLSQSAHLIHVLQRLYQRGLLTRFIFDEAHCVSRWGHDFRKDYTEFSCLKITYPNVPTTALTATASPTTRADILHQLSIPQAKWFHCSLNRPNLRYEVRKKGSRNQAMLELVLLLRSPQFINGSGIVFCFTKAECDSVASQLSRNGIMALAYHGGQDDKKRNQTHKAWLTNRVRIICSTVAFGVGINKPDVRIVVHYFIPKSIENYYQETGRAGRDGLNAHCILLYSFNDAMAVQRIILGSKGGNAIKKTMIENLNRMVAFCQNDSDCRRVLQLEHFGEKFNSDRCRANKATVCDNCSAEETYVTKDVTKESREFVQAILNICGSAGDRAIFNKKFTQSHFVDVFKGSMSKKVYEVGHNKISLHGKGKAWIKKDIESLIRKLIAENYLSEESIPSKHVSNCGNIYLRCGPKGNDLLEGRVKLEMPISIIKQKKKKVTQARVNTNNANSSVNVNIPAPALIPISTRPRAQVQSYSAATSNFENDIGQVQIDAYRELVMECQKIAVLLGLPNWSTLVLRIISGQLPETLDAMLNLPGVSSSKAFFSLHGNQLLEITKKYAETKRLKMLIHQPQLIRAVNPNIPSTYTSASAAGRNMGNTLDRSIDEIMINVNNQVVSVNYQLQQPNYYQAARGGRGVRGGRY